MMNNMTMFGFTSLISGVLLLGYQALAYLMDVNNQWREIFLGDLGDSYLYNFADHLPFEVLQQGGDFLINGLPFYQLLMAVGLFFILVGAFVKN